MDGAEWRPYQRPATITPPFPEYVSGHSAFSAAAAEVLRRFTGSDAFGDSVHIKGGSSNIEPGTVPSRDTILSWDTFTDAAEQAGMSRRYGGIHFKMGDLNGRKLGRAMGAQAFTKALSISMRRPQSFNQLCDSPLVTMMLWINSQVVVAAFFLDCHSLDIASLNAPKIRPGLSCTSFTNLSATNSFTLRPSPQRCARSQMLQSGRPSLRH
jgi:hypothetical protein